jgi:hypothetical protein
VLVIALLFVGSQWVKPQSLKLTLNWHSLEFELQRQQSGDTPRAGSTAMIRPGEIAGSNTPVRAARHWAVEVKRVADLAAVEQLTRYLELLNRDPLLAPWAAYSPPKR